MVDSQYFHRQILKSSYCRYGFWEVNSCTKEKKRLENEDTSQSNTLPNFFFHFFSNLFALKLLNLAKYQLYNQVYLLDTLFANIQVPMFETSEKPMLIVIMDDAS